MLVFIITFVVISLGLLVILGIGLYDKSQKDKIVEQFRSEIDEYENSERS